MKQIEALEILKSGKNVFLTGEPGAGKTHTINQFRDEMLSRGKQCAVTASTGIAATHIGGTTIHSFSGIGIKKGIGEADVNKVMGNMWKSREICETDVLIVDEVSMLDAQFIDDLDYMLKRVRADQSPFGGVQVIFVGDFFQLPPVTRPTEEDPNPETMFAFEAQAWQEAGLEVCYLTEQHRTSEMEFINILRRMRAGSITQADVDTLLASEGKIPDLKLFTHNADVDRLNRAELLRLPGQTYENCTYSEGIPFLKQWLIQNMLSPFKLELRVGAKVMFTKNNFEEGYVNGTIGRVVGFADRNPRVQLENSEHVVEVKKAEWKIEDEHGEVKARCVQYPLRLAYAITVHKSQGMSLDSAVINLSKVFEYGQGYVAVSRVRSLGGLKLLGASLESFHMHPKVVHFDQSIKP